MRYQNLIIFFIPVIKIQDCISVIPFIDKHNNHELNFQYYRYRCLYNSSMSAKWKSMTQPYPSKLNSIFTN